MERQSFGVKKGISWSSIDGGQRSDVMEIILTGPTHRDLGSWWLPWLSRPHSRALCSQLIKYGRTPESPQCFCSWPCLSDGLLGEWVRSSLWTHYNRRVSQPTERSQHTENTFFYMNLEGWCLPWYHYTYKRSCLNPCKNTFFLCSILSWITL